MLFQILLTSNKPFGVPHTCPTGHKEVEMFNRIIVQSDPSSTQPTRYSPERLQHIGMQVEALMSRYSSLKMHKRAIERQMAAIAARICEQDGVLLPRSIFTLL